jgi:pilus assembly protein CpaB
MFSTRNIIYLTFSIAVIGVIGIYLQLSATNTHAVNVLTAHEEKISVLTFNTDIDAGQAVLAQHFSWLQLPEREAENFVGLIKRQDFTLEKFKGAISRYPLASGDYVRFDSLVLPHDSDFLTTSLVEGKRAMAIKVDAQSAIAGLVSPGDRVDVIFYHKLKRSEEQDAWQLAASASVRQLVANVRLIAVDRQINKQEVAADDNNDSKIKYDDHSTVTLEVSVKQAEKLVIAQQLGRLSLLLRGSSGQYASRTSTDDTFTDNTFRDDIATNTVFADILPQFSQHAQRAHMVLMQGEKQVLSHAKEKQSGGK